MPSGPDVVGPHRTSPDAAHALLADRIRGGTVKVGVNLGVMGRPGAPTFRRWEAMLPALIGSALVLSALSVGGFVLGGIALAGALAAWFLRIAPWIRDRVHDRTVSGILSDRPTFENAWSMGAISLVHPGLPDCPSPQGDWVGWAGSLPAETEPAR